MREEEKQRTIDHIEKTAEKIYRFMATDSGKRDILNPRGSMPILDICDTPEECAKEVQRRFHQHVESCLKSVEVMGEFDTIKNRIEIFFEDTKKQLCEMEKDWVYTKLNDLASTSASLGMWYVILNDFGIAMTFNSLSFVFPIVVIVGLVVSFAVIAAGFVLGLFRKKREEKMKAIDTQYNNCMSSVRKIVRDQLNTNVGTVLTKLIDKVTVEKLPRQIEAMQEMVQQLLNSRQEIMKKRGLLLNLASKIDEMQKNVWKMQGDLLTNYLPETEKKSCEGST